MPCIITLLSVFFVRLPFVSFSLYLYILSHFSFSVSYAPDILPPMPPLTSSAPAVGAIPIPHFPVSFFSKSSLLVLILIYFLSLLLHLHLLLALMAVLLRKVCFSFFSLFFFLTCLFTAHAIFHATQDFYKQGICAQNSMLCSCSLPTIKVALIFASSNILQAIYSLENAVRNYKDATEE